jgi:murein DD-endopeptidase MepM/ murein hydrolase activator NlpD
MAKFGALGTAMKAASKLTESRNSNGSKEKNNLQKGVEVAANGKAAVATLPFLKYIIVAIIVILAVILLGGALSGVGQAIDNVSLPKCNSAPAAGGFISEAEKKGLILSPEAKEKANSTKATNPCREIGMGYDGSTYPPTTGTVTTLFGVRDALHPRAHNGMDIAGGCGTPIFAFSGGTVTTVTLGTEAKSTGSNFVYPGGTVIIKHTEEFSTMYHHLKGSTTFVRVGDVVSAGQTIAQQWSNGHSTGCHLHWEAYMGGNRIDPMTLLQAAGYDFALGKNFTALPPLPVPGQGGGSVGPPAAPGSSKAVAQQKVSANGWGANEWTCLEKLWTRESGWRVDAINPRFDPRSSPIPENQAYGIAQAAPGRKYASSGPNWKTDAGTQIDWGLGYIKQRYNTPCGAWGHSESHNWY